MLSPHDWQSRPTRTHRSGQIDIERPAPDDVVDIRDIIDLHHSRRVNEYIHSALLLQKPLDSGQDIPFLSNVTRLPMDTRFLRQSGKTLWLQPYRQHKCALGLEAARNSFTDSRCSARH
jgi:hypothetical protein